jgi:hypothetical protein
MTRDNVVEKFNKYIVNGTYLDLNNGIVSIDVFTEKFNIASSNPTYSEMLAIDGYVDDTNQGMGYKPFLDKCKSEGILT